ncbi:methylaspartate ammonia-lyase [Phyllobacterium sophorae]|uniref:methylaspartate ammonia-lyase n=1 Tax=Phyllobacterium sophorae TaxID=1520277 RepID=A0A2P7B3C6_9HYPH|nr:methylaspartate ammonia-lyase [Phyllobacterium sophorae]PSH60948.1 methylaspartate ammonia-lyase [Phyllobacterium sophorae]
MATAATVKDVIFAPGTGSFFYDDQAAIRAGIATDGFRYVGTPLTPGFTTIRMPSQSISIGLVLSDGAIVWGDMMSVQYSGASGRDPLFQTESIGSLARSVIVPRLLSVDVSNFLEACDRALAYHEGKRLPLAVEYGVSQALLAASAHVTRTTLAEVICSEYFLPLPDKRIPIYAQSGDAREINVDKMILKSVDVLPHGLINSREKFGPSGETFREFVKWVAKRTREIGEPGYHPTLHFDVYGWIGLEIGMDAGKIADFICTVADDVPGHRLHIESPADFGSTDAQLDEYVKIVNLLDARSSNARVVVDEQCNTLDDIRLFAEAKAAHIVQIKMPDVGSVADTVWGVLACKEQGVGAYVGGSCTETDLSARVSANVAIATQADMMLAKPGMGVDEGISIVGNEQSRLLAILNYRRAQNSIQNAKAQRP